MPKRTVYVNEQGAKVKPCTNCNEVKPLSDYYLTKSTLKDGTYATQGKCKSCYKEQRRNRYLRQKNNINNIVVDQDEQTGQ